MPYKLVYPPAHNDTYVKATSHYDYRFEAFFTTDPSKSLIGNSSEKAWGAYYPSGVGGTGANQRFHIDLGKASRVVGIHYENFHDAGGFTDVGAKNFTFQGSTTPGAFADLTYATDTNWATLAKSQASLDQHISADTTDPKYISVYNQNLYRYYAFKFADNWGYRDGCSYSWIQIRRIVLQVYTPQIISF